jgi:polyhydroxyalkanoate synthase
MLAYLKAGQEMASHPEKLEASQQDLFDRLLVLQKNFVKELCEDGNDSCINLQYNKKDGKYEDNPLENSPMIKFAQQFHETTSQWMLDSLEKFDGMDKKVMHTARFFMKQYIDLMSPNNFPFLNPKFWQKTLDTNGENIKDGIEMLLNDIKNGAITTNDKSKFSIGKNLAVTSGKVIYQNELIELIQYSPTTEKVFAKPILFVPPWINKFYILDLNKELSLVKWAVDNGFTVFMISWVNPNKEHRHLGFEHYMQDGLMNALDEIYNITKSKHIHTFGYCVGGTLISALLAYLANPLCKRRPKIQIDTATLLTTLLDFEHAGDMGIFMAENYLDAIRAQMGEKGYLDGQVMFNTFSALKANDMVWRYFVNSYMLGIKPNAHEILYWNSDPTNLTESMQMFLSKDMYRDNLLKLGALKIFGVPIDLKLINIPLYMISTKKDHLVPWEATFDGMNLFGVKPRFVLGGSGHVAGAINPPFRNKYCYWVNEKSAKTAQEWIETATEFAGSWWNDWLKWLAPMMGEMINARNIDVNRVIRDAPGIYVMNETEKA